MKLRIWKLLPPILIAGLIIATFCDLPIYTDDYEPNDDFEDAATVSPGVDIEATIKPDDDVDYYRLSIGGEDSVTLLYTLDVPAELRPEIRFYAAENKELIDYRKYSTELGTTLSDSLQIAAGDIWVRISSFSYEESDSSYTLRLTTSAPVVATGY